MSEHRQLLSPEASFVGHTDHGATRLTLLDYWKWSGSRLLDNLQRGMLAEFLVARALDVAHEPRYEWGTHDLDYRGCEIEVMSAAFAQAWRQGKASPISYNIAPRKWSWAPKTGDVWQALDAPKRTADIYVFSLLRRPDEKDRRDPNQHKPDPLDLSHWNFHVIDRQTLDDERPQQKRIALKPLIGLISNSARGKAHVQWGDLRTTVDGLVEQLP